MQPLPIAMTIMLRDRLARSNTNNKKFFSYW